MFCDLSFNFLNIFIITIDKHMDKCNMFLVCIEHVNALQLETITEKNIVKMSLQG